MARQSPGRELENIKQPNGNSGTEKKKNTTNEIKDLMNRSDSRLDTM